MDKMEVKNFHRFHDYFIVDNGEVIEGGNEPVGFMSEWVYKAIKKADHLKLDDDVSMKQEYSNVDCDTDYETEEQLTFNVRLGCFVKINGEYSLEVEYDKMTDILEEMKTLTLEEINDGIYSVYVEVVREPIESDYRYR